MSDGLSQERPKRRPKKIPTHRCTVPASTRRKRATPIDVTKWRRLRARILAREPACRVCGQIATQIDHIDNDSGNNALENLRPMCASCHSKKTVREDGGFGRPPGGGKISG